MSFHPDYQPYPPQRYDGDGEVSAWVRRGDEQPELMHRSGGSASYLATGAQTDGDFGLYRWDMVAGQGGPDPHFHKTISESFFVLTGTVKIFDGREWVDVREHDLVHVPPGGLHGFRNESDEPASMLLLFTPGAPREHYFETLSKGVQMTAEQRAEFFLRHDNHWV
jgi:mannose-6-phosphate isomerase-like protein (cupin superfamily)